MKLARYYHAKEWYLQCGGGGGGSGSGWINIPSTFADASDPSLTIFIHAYDGNYEKEEQRNEPEE